MQVIKPVLAFLFVSLLSSCMSMKLSYETPRFQWLSVGNRGKGTVRDFKITYGAYTIPRAGQTNFEEVPPMAGTAGSDGVEVPIPEKAEITWQFADGARHRTTVPSQEFVKDPEKHYGFAFCFIDDHIEVFRSTRIDMPNSRFTNVVREKVYPK